LHRRACLDGTLFYTFIWIYVTLMDDSPGLYKFTQVIHQKALDCKATLVGLDNLMQLSGAVCPGPATIQHV